MQCPGVRSSSPAQTGADSIAVPDSTGLGKREIHLLVNSLPSAQSSACSTLEGWLLPASTKPTISTEGAAWDAAQVHTGQPLKSDGYTHITGESRAALALPTWHSKKCLQSHTLCFSAPRTLQVLVGCVRSLLSCNSFRQYPRTGREMKEFVSWNDCKIPISAGRRGAVVSQQQPLTSISWPNQTSPLTDECKISLLGATALI